MNTKTPVDQARRRGRSRSVFFVITAFAFAGLVAFVVFGVVQRFNVELQEAREPIPTVEVVVALEELPIGGEILERHIDVIEVPPELLPGEDTFDAIEAVVGRTPRERVLPGEIIRDARLASAADGVGLNVLVTPGKRAMTIETDSQSGVGGFLQPGYRVDTIVTIRPDDNAMKAKWVTETILQDVIVLAVGGDLSGPTTSSDAERRRRSASRRNRNYVTLEVDVEQAEKLALASARGDLHLALRSDIDLEPTADRGPLSTNEMVGLRAARRRAVRRTPSKSKPEPKLETTEVITGGKTVIETFDESGRKVSETRKNK
ncbi:MAG: Flp pilus assembly protein CpaB [Deltaproteobacteria bacterium]|nr:Flp pilus assembly protein CpaB [Deltaproteobacteria bacterium]